jgi:Subtilase family
MSIGLRLLVKTRNATPKASSGLDNGRTGATSAPLFHSIGQGRTKSAPAAFSWHVVTLVPAETDSPWQACHNLVTQSAVTSAPIDFAEPDLQQQWLLRREDLRGLSITGTCVTAIGPDLDYPTVAGNPLWFRDLAHGQYDAALTELTDPGEGKRVRVAHLDTGYDPNHQTLPTFLNRSLQRNFVDPTSPQDAQDETSGLFNNLGHGTGTLSILAGAGVDGGKPFGVAPFSEVIPIRIANRVVLFSNSAIAQAFDYVHGLCRASATRVHVITLSIILIAAQKIASRSRCCTALPKELYDGKTPWVGTCASQAGGPPARQQGAGASERRGGADTQRIPAARRSIPRRARRHTDFNP